MFGGGPLPKEVGDGLAEKGVNIFTLFGSSVVSYLLCQAFVNCNYLGQRAVC